MLHITLISLFLFFSSLSDSLFRGGGPKINLTGKEKNQMQIGLPPPDSQNALGMRLSIGDFSLIFSLSERGGSSCFCLQQISRVQTVLAF